MIKGEHANVFLVNSGSIWSIWLPATQYRFQTQCPITVFETLLVGRFFHLDITEVWAFVVYLLEQLANGAEEQKV